MPHCFPVCFHPSLSTFQFPFHQLSSYGISALSMFSLPWPGGQKRGTDHLDVPISHLNVDFLLINSFGVRWCKD